jgi:hypothetical protein
MDVLVGRTGDVSDVPGTADVSAVRALLKLDKGDHFYNAGVMAAVYSCKPAASYMPDDRRPSLLMPGGAKVANTEIYGGKLVPYNRQSIPYVDGSVAGSMGFRELLLRSDVPGVFTIQIDDAPAMSIAVKVTQLDGAKMLESMDIKNLGVMGNILVDDPWYGEVMIAVKPRRYPYAAAAAALSGSSRAVKLMAEEGTLELFSVAQQSLRKVGAAGLAIIKNYFRVAGVPLAQAVDDCVTDV